MEASLGVLDVDGEAESKLRSAVLEVSAGFGDAAQRRPKDLAITAVEAFTEAAKARPSAIVPLSKPPNRRLAMALETLRAGQLAELDLSDDPSFGDEGVIALCRSLLGHAPLKELRLVRVGCGLDGALAVAEVVAVSLKLRLLQLSHNTGIGDDGAVALARALRASCALESLHLRDCGIGDLGASAIAGSIAARRRSPLVLLDLSFNALIGISAVDRLRDAAAISRSLTTLSLAGAAATPSLLAATQLALTPAGKATLTGAELWAAGVKSDFTSRFAPDQAEPVTGG
jgi:hypothetical protein